MSNRKSKGKTTKSLPVDTHGPTAYSHEEGVKAFESLQPLLTAMADTDVEMGRIDVEMAAYAALSVSKTVQSEEVRSRFAELPKRAFDMINVDGLGEAALATLYAMEGVQDEGALNTRAKLPPEVAQEALEVERRMQTVCEYLLSDDPEISPLLDELRPGVGYRDTLKDLKGYGRIYERRPEIVKTDPKNYRPGDLKRSRELVAIIGQAFIDGMSKSARTAYEMHARCWTLLSRRYEQVRQTGLWLYRADPRKDEMFPSLYTAARPNVGRPRRAPERPTVDESIPPSGEQDKPLANVA